MQKKNEVHRSSLSDSEMNHLMTIVTGEISNLKKIIFDVFLPSFILDYDLPPTPARMYAPIWQNPPSNMNVGWFSSGFTQDFSTSDSSILHESSAQKNLLLFHRQK